MTSNLHSIATDNYQIFTDFIIDEVAIVIFSLFIVILLYSCIITLYLLGKRTLKVYRVPCKTKLSLQRFRFFGLEDRRSKIKHNYHGEL